MVEKRTFCIKDFNGEAKIWAPRGHNFLDIDFSKRDQMIDLCNMLLPEIAKFSKEGYTDLENEETESKMNALRDLMTQTLEEKFGVQVKICANCKNFTLFDEVRRLKSGGGDGECPTAPDSVGVTVSRYESLHDVDWPIYTVYLDSTCQYWTPREVSPPKTTARSG